MPFLNALFSFLLALPLGMGIGSGGLFLIYLSDILSLPRNTAIYLNLIFFLSALLSSFVGHLRAKRISFPMLRTVLFFGIPGTYLGRALAALLPSHLLKLFLGIFLLSSGIFSLLSLKNAKDRATALDKP